MIASRLRAVHHIPPSAAGANIITVSRDLTAWITTGGPTVTYDQVGIDGAANTATLVTDASAAAYSLIQKSYTRGSGFNTFRCYIKAQVGATFAPMVRLGYASTASVYAQVPFDLDTGQYVLKGTTSIIDAVSITKYNGWLRIIVGVHDSSSNESINVSLYPAVAATWDSNYSVSAQGSITVGQAELYEGTISPARLWRAPLVYTP